MVNHSALYKSIKHDYINILTWTILKKTQILNGCKTFAFKYIYFFKKLSNMLSASLIQSSISPCGNEINKAMLNSYTPVCLATEAI